MRENTKKISKNHRLFFHVKEIGGICRHTLELYTDDPGYLYKHLAHKPSKISFALKIDLDAKANRIDDLCQLHVARERKSRIVAIIQDDFLFGLMN